MDVRDIEYFAVLAEHGQLVRAAEALGLSQPALSLSLRRLEKSAQAKLVKRTPKGVELTAVGTALLSHVRRLRLARDDLAREVADLAQGRAGNLRIGASPVIAEFNLPEVCSTLLKDAPRISLVVTVRNSDVLLPALRRGDLDFAVIHPRHHSYPDIEQFVLGEDELVVYCSVTHHLAKRKSVKLPDLSQEQWGITPNASEFWLKRSFEEQGLAPPRLTLTSDSVALMLRTAASSTLLGIASRCIVQAAMQNLGLAILPVKGSKWIRPVAVTFRKDSYLSPAAQRFIDILKKTAKGIAGDEASDAVTASGQRSAPRRGPSR